LCEPLEKIILKTAVERGKAVQAIDVNREWTNCMVTFWVMSQCVHFLGACADFRDPIAVFRIIQCDGGLPGSPPPQGSHRRTGRSKKKRKVKSGSEKAMDLPFPLSLLPFYFTLVTSSYPLHHNCDCSAVRPCSQGKLQDF